MQPRPPGRAPLGCASRERGPWNAAGPHSATNSGLFEPIAKGATWCNMVQPCRVHGVHSVAGCNCTSKLKVTGVLSFIRVFCAPGHRQPHLGWASVFWCRTASVASWYASTPNLRSSIKLSACSIHGWKLAKLIADEALPSNCQLDYSVQVWLDSTLLN